MGSAAAAPTVTDAESASAGCLHPPGVRASALSAIGAADPGSPEKGRTGEQRPGEYDEHGGQYGGNEVHEVVQTGGGLAEEFVAIIAVSPHGIQRVDASIDGFVSDGSETELSLFVSGVDSSGVIHGDSVDVKFVVDRLGRSLVPALDLNVAGYACGDSHVLPVSLFNGGLTGEENVTLMFEVPQLGVLESVTVPSLGMSESFDHNFAVDIPNVKSGNYSARLSGFYGSELGGEYVFDFPVSCDDYNLFKSEFVEWFFLILGYGLVVGGFVFLYLNGFGKKRK